METCEKHGKPLVRPEVRDEHGLLLKTLPACEDCQREERDRILSRFGPPWRPSIELPNG